MICNIFSTNKVLEIRLVILIPLTTIPKFNWQLCLNLTNPNFAWFNSHSIKKVPTPGLESSYLRMSILSVFYGFYTHFIYLQPYQVEHTSSCLITAVKQHWAESSHRTFFSVYQLCKIPYKKIFPLYLLYAHHLKRKSTYMTQRKKINKTNTIEL